MATKISEQELANLAINLVKSPSAFQQMQQANQIQPDEFYLVEGDDAATYTFQDFTNGRFIINQIKNGVVTPMTINTGSITGGSAITNDATVIGGIVPTGVQGYELSALKKTISGQNGVVVSASGTNSIIIGLDAVTGLTAGSVGPISAISPGHGETVSIPYITYDTYGRITSAVNRVLTLPVETQLSAAVPDGVTAYNVGQANDFYVIGGLTTSNHQITVAKKKLSAGAAMTIATASNEIVIAHSDTSTLAAGAHNAGDGAFIRSITTDEYGHITAVSTADESTAPTIAIDSNASDPNNPTLIAGLTAENHLIKVARKTITAGTGVAVSNTSSAITIALASGVSSVAVATDTLTHGGSLAVPVPTVDTYGRVTKVTTITYTMPSESGLQGGSASGDDFDVVTGVTGSGHTLSVAKKTLTAGTGIALSKSSTALTIALSTLNSAGSYGPGSGVSATSTSPTEVAFGGSVLVPYVTIDSYGRTSAASTKYYKLPTIGAASNAGTDANSAAVIAGLTTSGTTAVTINPAKKTITAGSGMVVTANSAAITIGIQSLTVSASAATASLAHGDTVALPSSITVNSLGQVTAIKTTTYKMPAETQLSIGNNAGVTNCELINSITVNNHAITLTKSKIVAGTAIAVASKNNNGQYNIEISHGSTNAASSVASAADTFINGLTLDSFGHVVGISTAVESTGASLSVSSNAGDNGMVITGMTLGGDHNHEITVVKRAISAGNAITVSTTTAGKIIINHSVTSSAVTVASAAGKFVNAISVDTYGHVTGMTTTSETVLAASGTTGTENNKVITGLAFSGHSIYAAKKTLEGINGITVTNATDKLSIGITTLTVGVTSGTKTLSHGGTVTVLSSVTTNSYGQTTAVKTVELTMPSETALSFSGSLSGADNGQVLTGFSVSGHQISSIARRSIVGGGMIIVNTGTAGQISIAHSTPSSVGSNITAASGKFLSGITLDSYGHVTAVTTSSSNIGGHNIPIFMKNGVVTPSSATIGSQTQFIYMSSGAILPSTTTVGSGIKPIYLNSGTLTVSSDTVGTNLKPVYLSSGTITVGAYELKATVDSGTAKGLAYYSGVNTISCESRIFQNRSNRYPLDFTLQNDAGSRVAEIWYDAGDTTNVTSGSWRFREYSPNSTADTSTTGYYESYYLPTVNTGLTESAAYNILTTKSLITVAQGGTGASTVAGARANLATWAYINDGYPTIIGPDGTTNNWFKIGTANTAYGILPSQSGGIGSGHNYLGTSSWYWQYSYIDEMYGHHLTIQGATSATMSANSTNPRITFSEGTGGTQPVHLIYSDYDSYRAPAGLKVIGGTSATPAWFEVEGTIFAGGNAFFANSDGIKVPCASSSWIDGHNTSQRSIQMTNANNTSGYWPWIKQYNSSSSRYWSIGTLNTTLYFITSASSRTANGYDVGWEMRANGTFYSANLATARYGTGAPSGTYDNGTLYFQYT